VKTIIKRFETKFIKKGADDCWEWEAGTFGGRYGQFKFNGNPTLAHRIAYEIHYGPFPAHFNVCHTCDNGLCVNPNHLFLGTSLDNNRDKIEKGRDNYGYGAARSDAKFTMPQVRRVREFSSTGTPTSELASLFKVDPETIRKIILHKTYKEEFV
jgi:hypothetical protein